MEPPNDLPEGSLRFRHEKVNIHLGFILGRLVAGRTGPSEAGRRNVRLAPAVVSQSLLKESDMRKLMLLAGAAALGLTMPALAQGQGQGRGGGQGKGQAAQAEQKGGGQGRAERGRGKQQQARGNERGGGEQARGRGRGNEQNAERRMNRDERRAERAIQQERRAVREARQDDRRLERGRGDDRLVRLDGRRDWRGWADRRLVSGDRFDDDSFRGRRLAIGPEGCPPGLAKQNAYCMPPGQLRRWQRAQLIGQRLPFSSLGYNIPERYRYRFADDDRFIYRYGNDNMVYRFDRGSGLVNSIFPLASNGLFLGEPLPIGYDVYNVPYAYRGYYPDTRDSLYRYDGNAIYRVDPQTRLVEGIVALLTGGTGGLGALGVGDRLPMGYSAYNVPYAYRDTYYDNDDSMYRYADGAIYQVDPQTQLIQAIISLLV
jgi:hypothetical protein